MWILKVLTVKEERETGFVLEFDVECIITLAGQNALRAKCQGILVELRDGQLYKCKMCQRFTKDATIRYKVEVMAYDRPASITLLLWDDETATLVGQKVDDVKNDMDPLELKVPYQKYQHG